MANTYELALREVARQVQAIGTTRLFSDPIQVRELDWDDVVKVGGATIRYDLNAIREDQSATNERDVYGYPCILVLAQGWRAQFVDDISAGADFLHRIRAHFHNRRTMTYGETSFGPGINQLPTTMTSGPHPPNKYSDKKIVTRTIWAWFLEPRSTESFPA